MNRKFYIEFILHTYKQLFQSINLKTDLTLKFESLKRLIMIITCYADIIDSISMGFNKFLKEFEKIVTIEISFKSNTGH